jgi:hypothetical protein
LVGEDVDVDPSLTSAYCSPEGVVMNCKSGVMFPGETAALAIVVGVERMVDAAVIAAM